jgi:uroporphyrinogen-III synthase
MTVQVVVTRPRDESGALAEEIARLGFTPLIAPMLAVEMLPATLPDLSGYAALAFTSANGVRAFAQLSAERAMPAYAVGDATASVLDQAGFADIRPAGGDAEALAALIAGATDRRPVLHVSGHVVARDLGILLAPSGIAVDRVALYEAKPASILPADLVDGLYACTVGYVLFYSARTAMIFGTLVNASGLTEMVRATTAICLSAPVAAEASALPWSRVKIAAHPRTRDVLACLQEGI